MKRRNILAVWLGLPIITLGIYSFVWVYKIHKELGQSFPRVAVTGSGNAVLSCIFGFLTLFIWPLIVLIRFGRSLQEAQILAGERILFNQALGLLLMFFGFGPLYYQSELNRLVAATKPAS